MKFGTKEITAAYFGSTPITAAYIGTIPLMGMGGVKYPLSNLLILGDSHIEAHANARNTVIGPLRKIQGFSLITQAELNHSFALVSRLNGYPTGAVLEDIHHGYAGRTSAELTNGFTGYTGANSPSSYALTTDFDAVLICAGGNDVATVDGPTAAAQIVALGVKMAGSGKPVIIGGIFPRMALRGQVPLTQEQSNTERDRIAAANAALPALCSANGLLWLPWHTEIETDEDGFATDRHLINLTSEGWRDGTHLLPLGAHVVSRPLTALLQSRFITGTPFEPPADGSALWQSRNPYMAGAAGSLATDWTKNGTAGTVAYAKVTDAQGRLWQEVTISGNTTYGQVSFFMISNPAQTPAFVPGTTIRTCCQFQGVAAGWDFKAIYLAQEVSNPTARTNLDMYDGGPATRAEPLLPFSGTLLTESQPTLETATQVLPRLYTHGNGTFRFRACGTFAVG